MAQPFSLRLVFCSLFLFACHALAGSAVLGIDLGTEYIKAVLVKPGTPLEIVLTKDSRRKETSAVAFKPPRGAPKPDEYPERAYGSDAMALAPRFPGDVYPNLKTLLGLTVDGNSVVHEYAARHPALKLGAHKSRKTVTFTSRDAFVDGKGMWLVEELLAMELESVRHNAEALAGPGTSIRSVVITVPPFYTADEKRAVKLAAKLARLHVLSLISDGLAVGLNYATSRQFPSISGGAKPEINLVFDMGAGSTKATILKFQSRSVKDVGKFNKTVQEVEVLGSGWDRTLGGDTLNALIVDDMVSQFVDSSAAKAAGITDERVKAHGRTVAKLSKEAERVRHVLSANTNTAATFEGLFEDIDFRYKISRADFEAMAAAHAERVNGAVQAALGMAGLQVKDLNSVILHGGATRTPFVQKQLETVFGGSEKLRTNVNSDEAAVFGAGFRAAELSPSFRVKEIRVSEGATYGIIMKPVDGDTTPMVVTKKQLWGPTSHLGTAAEELTYSISEGTKAEQSVIFYQQIHATDGKLGDWPIKAFRTSNLSVTVDKLVAKYACDINTVQFKLGLKLNSETGEVEVTKAVAGCESDDPEKEGIMDGVKNLFGFGKSKDQQPLKEGEEAEKSKEAAGPSSITTSSGTSSSSQTPAAVLSDTATAAFGEKGPKELVSIPVQFVLENAGIPELSDDEYKTAKKRVLAFDSSDRARRYREEVFNNLESFTYKVRGLLENETFLAMTTVDERNRLDEMNRDVSDWLYDGGIDASTDDILRYTTNLAAPVDVIEKRIEEHKKRPGLVQSLKEAIAQNRQFTQAIRERIVEYEAYLASKSSAPSVEPSADTASVSSAEGFDGLEDGDAPAPTEGLQEDKGPAAPIYTVEDLEESEGLCESVDAWLAEKEAAQAKMQFWEIPALSVKELEAKRERLEKAGTDLAMKALRNFEKTQKKGSSKSKKTNKTKTTASAKTSSTTSTSPEETSELPQKGGGNAEIKHEEL